MERSAKAQSLENTNRAQVDAHRIASAAAIVTFFFVLSRLSGLLREGVIAARFGAGAELDAYLAAFRVPDLLFQLVAGGALGSAFIPVFAGYWTRGDEAGAWVLFSRVLNLITLALTVIAGVAALFTPLLVRQFIAPGFDPAQQALAASLMRWMLVSTVVFGASGLVMGALNAVQHFLLSAAAPLFYNLAIIGGAWMLAPQVGVHGLAIGVVAGAFAHLVVQLPGLWRMNARYHASLNWRDMGVRSVTRLMGPRVLGLFFVQMHFLVNTILASGLAAGSLSALNFAWLLMLLPQGVFAQSLATAVFPTLAAQVAQGDLAAMRQTFSRTLRMVLFLCVPSAFGLVVLGPELVSALLERGAFDAASSARVAHALAFYAIGLAGHAALEIIVRAFYALHDTKTPVSVGVGAMLLNIALSLAWVNSLGFGGLALANSVATSGEALLLLWLLGRKLDGFDGRTVWMALARQLLAASLMGAVLYGWQYGGRIMLAHRSEPISTWVIAGGGLVIGAAVYGLAMRALGSDELQPLLEQAQVRLRRLQRR
jgi:putative peptidoglycan lipid II flippase